MYSVYGIAFDGVNSWSFGNDYATNVVIFGFDNSSLSHSDNHKNNFLILREGLTSNINGSFGSLEKSLVSILLKQNHNIAWVYITIIITVIFC